MPSDDFLRRNPRYQQAGDWRFDTRRNQASVPFRERKPQPGSNMDVFHFKNMGYSTEEAEQMASEARSGGERTSFGGKGIERINRRTESRQETSAPSGPTDDQRKWAKSFRDSQPQKPSAPTESGGGSLLGAAARTFKTAVGMPSSATAAPKEPLNFSRSALVEGAKKSGDFANIREGFNTQSQQSGTGMRMDKNGSMTPLPKTPSGPDGTSKFAREKFGAAVEDIRARRDFARGEAMNKSVSQGVGTMTKTNPYGSASATYGGKPTGPGMMPDPLTGKQVPMRQRAKDQTAVQGTKFAPFPTTGSAQSAPTPSKPAQVRAAVAGSRPAPLSTAMTGDTGTIKSPLPLPRGGLPAQSSGIATDDPVIRKGISTMSGNQSGLGTINSPFGGGLPFGASASPTSGPAQIRKSVSGGSASPTSGPAQALPKASTPNATSSSGSGQRSTGQMPNVGYTNDRSKMSKDEAVEHYQKTGDATALEGYMKANPSEKMKLIQRESDVWNKISGNSSAREKALAAQREAESHREEYIKKNNWLGPIGEGATARGWANQNPDKAKALTNYGPSYQDDRKMMDYANRLNAQQVAGSDEKRTSGSTSFNSNNFRRRARV